MPHEDDRKTPLSDLDAKTLDAESAEKVKGGITPTEFKFVKKVDKSSSTLG